MFRSSLRSGGVYMNFLLDPGIAIYMAMAVALVVWIGIFVFLLRIDSQARELRRKLEQQPTVGQPAPRATVEARNGRPNPPVTTADQP